MYKLIPDGILVFLQVVKLTHMCCSYDPKSFPNIKWGQRITVSQSMSNGKEFS